MYKTNLKIAKKSYLLLAGLGITLMLVLSNSGTFAQSVTINPVSVGSVQTSNSSNFLDLIKTGTNTNSGLRFFQNQDFRGGVFYNDQQNTLNVTGNAITPGLIWNYSLLRAGIGLNFPSAKLHIFSNGAYNLPQLLVHENDDAEGARINLENAGSPNRRWTLYGRNSNSGGANENVFNIFHTSFGNIAQFTEDGNTRMNGFTQLGYDAPKIKVRKYSGTLDSDAYTDITFDIPLTKIVSYSGHVIGDPPNIRLFPPNDEIVDYKYRLFLEATSIKFEGVPDLLWGKQFVVYITYEE